MTRVLGIDPGSHKTGWGVVDVIRADGRARVVHVDNGVLFLDDDTDLTIRLTDLCRRLRDVVTRYAPTEAAVEDIFVRHGARSALILGQARGAALATLGLCDLAVRSYPAPVVKQTVAGNGRAEKGQVAEMVRVQLQLPEVPFEDAADALAVALCAAFAGASPRSGVAALAAPGRTRGGARAGLRALAEAQGKLAALPRRGRSS